MQIAFTLSMKTPVLKYPMQNNKVFREIFKKISGLSMNCCTDKDEWKLVTGVH
jgi:hypothetical protein